jgi:hypothetical protein
MDMLLLAPPRTSLPLQLGSIMRLYTSSARCTRWNFHGEVFMESKQCHSYSTVGEVCETGAASFEGNGRSYHLPPYTVIPRVPDHGINA